MPPGLRKQREVRIRKLEQGAVRGLSGAETQTSEEVTPTGGGRYLKGVRRTSSASDDETAECDELLFPPG